MIEVVSVDYRNVEQAQDLVYLLNQYAQDDMGGGQPLNPKVVDGLTEAMANVPGAFSFVVYVDGKPAGLANNFMGFSTFKAKPLVNIHDLAVLSDYRGLGLSQVLLKAVEDRARSLGCCKVTLEVLGGNKAAKSAYLKYGFSGYELDPETGKAEFWEKPL